jgi:hypothetical protein
MEWFGGVYNFLIIVAIVIFFFSIASLTGGLSFFLSPLKWLLPSPLGLNPAAGM